MYRLLYEHILAKCKVTLSYSAIDMPDIYLALIHPG